MSVMGSQNVPDGFKQTEVGVIPEDWNVTPLQRVCRAPITYGIVQCGPHVNNGIPYIRVSDMNTTELDVNGMLRTSSEIAASFVRSTVEEGDIVYALRGKLGEVKMVGPLVAGANLTQGTARISPDKTICNKYLFWALRSSQSLKQAVKEAKGSTFVEITLANLKEVGIPVPKLIKEQTAIANALSDVDALIASLEKLIAKKNAIKTAAMQQLLTGKKRLPPFCAGTHLSGGTMDGEEPIAQTASGKKIGYKQTELGEIPEDWEVAILGESVDFLDGQRKPVKSGDRERMRGVYRYYGASGVVDYVNGYLFDGEYILLGEDGENILSRNLPLAFKVVGKFWVNNHAHIMQPRNGFNIDYLTAFLENLDYSLLNSGTAQPKLNKQNCLSIKVVKPPEKEQSAIAKVLNDMGFELDALQQRLEKTRQFKQGMMQELLTGKTRLV